MEKLGNYINYLKENFPDHLRKTTATVNTDRDNFDNSYNPEYIKENEAVNYPDIKNELINYLDGSLQINFLNKCKEARLPFSATNKVISDFKTSIISLLPQYTKNVAEAAEIMIELDNKLSALNEKLIVQSEENNQHSEDKFHYEERQRFQFLGQLPLAVIAINTDGKPFYANKRTMEIIGKETEKDTINLDALYQTYTSGANKSALNAEILIKDALKGINSYLDNIEIQYNDNIIPLEVWGSHIKDENGKVIYAIAIFNDISKRKTLEDELRKKEIFLDSIIENLPHMLFVKDAKELRFVRFNKVGEELLGFAKKDMIGKNDYDFFPKEQADFFTSKDRSVLDSGQLFDIPEEVIQTHFKGERILHTKKIPILDEKGIPLYLLGISEDITERKKADDALEQRTLELARSNTDLEQFAYVASHDLQEPLRTVASYVQLLQKRYFEKLDNEAKEFIQFAVEGVSRMQNLINALLQYSRISTRGQEPAPTNIETIIESVKQNLHEAINENKATIVSETEMPIIKADEAQMIQLFQNLIGNAIKFKGDKDPVINISAKKQDNKWLFAISDNGIGIPKNELERIFVIFQRLHSRDEYQGTGIGLAVCKKIVERHGGSIWAESEEGKGTTFYFTLRENPEGTLQKSTSESDENASEENQKSIENETKSEQASTETPKSE